MANKIKTEPVVTPVFTAWWTDLEEPNELSGKYRVVAVFDEGEQLTQLKKAMKSAVVAKWGKDIPKNLHNPIKKPEDEKSPDMWPEDTLHVAFSTKKPYLLDRNGTTVLPPDRFYPGCKCRAVVVPWPYDAKGDNPPGVTCMLNALQFVDDGERLGGGTTEARNMLAANPLTSAESDEPAVDDDEEFSF